ncbi:MAG: ATP-binding protein [Lentimicrobiaceae bacterium]|nr:ATP-binding protein [Lentimicrobiaceae bacterium]
MFSKSFIKISIFIFTLIGSIVLCTVSMSNGWNIIAFIAILIALISVIFIFNVYRKSTLKVAFMFDSIENDDFTFRFTGPSARLQSDELLNHSLNRIKDLVIEARQEVREREKYFEHILNQVTTGIIVVNEQGIVFNRNQHALRLLGLSQLTHIRQLSQISEGLDRPFMALNEDENRKVSFFGEASEVTLNIAATFVDLQNKRLKIIALTDIATDIEEAQEESWQRMSNVLTHEIMNSLAPITSLSESLLKTSDQEMIRQGLEIINSTAGGLKKFVENYRSLSRIPAPQVQDIELDKFVKKETELLSAEIHVKIETTTCVVSADKGQISQVLLNLLKNAMEAISESGDPNAKIWVEVGRNLKGSLYIDVCNTGIPISDEIRDNVFVPFFTTKEDGNGIGLSISRQIMRLHEGTLTLVTKPFTRFRMQF